MSKIFFWIITKYVFNDSTQNSYDAGHYFIIIDYQLKFL